MGTEKNMNLEERIFKVLKHFNLKNANFVGSGLPDWRGLAVNYPEVISSMTLVCPWGFDPVTAKSLSSRLLVIRGSEGPMAEQVKNALGNLPEVSQVTLSDYAGMIWNDIAADRKKEISSAILDFVGNIVSGKEIETLDLPKAKGEIAGISYHLQGKGKPIVLLPR